MSLTLTLPSSNVTWPNGSTAKVTPSFDSAGKVTSLTLELSYKGKNYRHEAATLDDLYAILSKLP